MSANEEIEMLVDEPEPAPPEPESAPPSNSNGNNELPWVAYNNYFKLLSKDESNFKVQCLLCIKTSSTVSTSVKSASNLKRHIQRSHKDKEKELAAALESTKRRSGEGESEGGRQRQATLDGFFSGSGTKKPKLRAVTQQDVDRVVLKHVIIGLRPFSTVEDPTFRECVLLGAPEKCKVMCTKTLRSRIQALFQDMKTKLTEAFRDIPYVATTADGWTKFKRAYIGIMVLWIDPETLERRKAVLACRRLRGRHTFDVLAAVMDEVYKEFGIHNKISKTTTDGGSNYVKAHKDYGEDGRQTQFEEEDEEDIEDFGEAVEIAPILNDGSSGAGDGSDVDFNEIILPKHQVCASHSLNRVAVADSKKVDVGLAGEEQMVSSSAMKKCRALWTRQNKSTVVADEIHGILQKYLITPNDTRWNGEFDSIEQIAILCEDERGLAKAHAVFDAASLPRLTNAEISYLKEYREVMGPLARALDILQGDEKGYQGYLLPTIVSLEIRLKELIGRPVRYCAALAEAVLKGVEQRFESAMTDTQNIIASCTHPAFKLSWMAPSQAATQRRREEEDMALCKKYEKMVIEEMVQLRQTGVTPDPAASETPDQPQAPEDEFFRLRPSPLTSRSRSDYEVCREEFRNYLSDTDKSVKSVLKYPNVRRVFVKSNTPVPSSASNERLFSTSGNVLTKNRAKMSDSRFEQQLMLKTNKDFVQDF